MSLVLQESLNIRRIVRNYGGLLVKEYAVIGLGRFGSSVAKCLCSLGHNVLGVDRDPDKVQELRDCLTHAVEADATREHVLNTLGLRNFDAVVVSIGNDLAASAMITLILKRSGAKCVIAKASNELHGQLLEEIGADRVVYPERDMGLRVAHWLISGQVLDFMELTPGYSIIEIVAPEALVNKALKELNLAGRFGIKVMAIKRGDDINLTPKGDDYIRGGDVLVLVGKNNSIGKFEEHISRSS